MDPSLRSICGLSCFATVVEFLDIKSALQLRATCRSVRQACSGLELANWRQQVVLPALQLYRVAQPRRWAEMVPGMTDTHASWLFDNVGESVKKVDLGEAPFLTDNLLVKIAKECGGSLEHFSMRRDSDALRVTNYLSLQRLTTVGPMALVKNCTQLKHLCLSWCEYVKGDELCQAIQENPDLCHHLEYLSLDGVRSVTDVAIRALASATNLRVLRLRDNRATDISPLAACTQLESLHLCRGAHIQPEGVIAACQGFQNTIRDLCCAGCYNIDAEAAKAVLQLRPPHLQCWNCLRGTKVGLGGQVSREVKRLAVDLYYSVGCDIVLDDPSCPELLL